MSKVSDKLVKVDERFSIYMYDNGFMVEVDGRDDEDDYKTTKLLCNTLDEVLEIVKEVADMDRSN